MKSASKIYQDGRNDKKFDLDGLIKANRANYWIYYAGKGWKEFDYDKGLDGLIKASKTGEYIFRAGISWKKFDFIKASNALIKIDKKGEWIYRAGKHWKKFDYEKALKQINPLYYKVALKDWPMGIEQSKKKIKKLEKTSKKLPMKKLKLEDVLKTFSVELMKSKDKTKEHI